MNRTTFFTGLVALIPTLVMADAVVHVRADQPSTVYIDGQLAGPAPLSLSNLHSGKHRLEIVNSQSSAAQQFLIYSPNHLTVEREVAVHWNPPAPLPAPAVSHVPVLQETPVANESITNEDAVPEGVPGQVCVPAPVAPPVVAVPPATYYVRETKRVVVVSPYSSPQSGYTYVPSYQP